MKISLTFILSIMTFCVSAQMKYKFKQYMLHPMIYNPGYVDIETKYSVNTLYRRQWLRQSNYPEVFFAYGHYNIDPSHSVGLLISNDLVNKYNQFEIGANYVYNIPVGYDYNLGLGIKLGMMEQNLLDTKLTYFDPVEPTLNDPQFTQKYINVGTGVSLTSKNLVLNLGIPQFFGNHLLNEEMTYNLKYATFFFNAGYKFRETDWQIIYPNMMLYAVRGSKVHGSLQVHALLGQLAWFGGGIDTDLTANLSLGMFFQSGFRWVYNVDNRFFPKNQTTGFSHELSISYAKTIRYDPFKRRKTRGWR